METKGSTLFEKISLLILAAWFIPWLVSLSDNADLLRVALLTFVTLVGVIAAVNGIKLFMQKMNVSAETNKTISWLLVVFGTMIAVVVILGGIVSNVNDEYDVGKPHVATYEFAGITHYVYDDPIPLTLEQLGIDADYEYRSRAQDVTESMLITVYNGQEIAPWGTPVKNPPELYYTLTIPRFKALTEHCAADILDDQRIRGLYGEVVAVDTEHWSAEAAYGCVDEDDTEPRYYILIYADRIVEISFPSVPTEEQIQTAVSVLKNYKP